MKYFLKSESFNLAMLSAFALAILFYRFYAAENIKFIFLAWNLVLAWVPYLVTLGLSQTRHKAIAMLKIMVWLLFLPNSPYMITDMLHLHPRAESPYWYDTFIMFVFAFNGVILFYASTRRVWDYFNSISRRVALLVMPVCFALCGYGIYMGRWLRFNSWDAVHHPFRMTNTLVRHTFDSANLVLIMQVTLLFGSMLFFIYRVLRSFR